jgi:elongation factor Ts
MAITTEQIKELRDATGVSVMQCKKALEEAGGDMEKALMILKKKSSDIAIKKADRETNDGIIVVKQNPGKAIVLVLSCETDFVAKNEDFLGLAETLANMAATDGKDATLAKAPELISQVVQKVGENIQIHTIETIEAPVVGSYVHSGKSAAVVALSSGGNEALAKDVAMHVAAMKPEYATLEDVSPETKDKVKEMFAKEVTESDKPEDIKAKMLEGKIGTYLKEQVLVEQPFVKNPDATIGKLLADAGAKLEKFVRYSI